MSPADGKWDFYPLTDASGAGGSLANAFRTHDSAQLVGREVVQNSWDAAMKLLKLLPQESANFCMDFRFLSVAGAEKQAVIDAMGMAELGARIDQVGDNTNLPQQAMSDILNPEVPLRLLEVSDWGAHGLYGHPQRHPYESVMFNAIYLTGDSNKGGSEDTSGGSYGQGKAAFIRGSEPRIVFFYSAFRPYPGEINEDDPVTRRLVGFGWWPKHKVNGKSFTGRMHFADLSHDRETGAGSDRVPFEDSEADSIARKLGLPTRDPSEFGQLGTSLLLLSPTVEPEELRLALEQFWWPALEDSSMDLRIYDYDGTLREVRPQRHSYLMPFINAYRIATGVNTVKPPGQMTKSLGKAGQASSAGKIALVALATENGEDASVVDDESDDSDFGSGFFRKPSKSYVAMMREPRMVVKYQESHLNHRVPARGVFIASPQVDAALRDTEPPLHDEWSTKPQDDVQPESTRIADATMKQVRAAVNDFARSIVPPPPRNPVSLPAFQTFANLLNPRGKGIGPGPHPNPSASPFEMHYEFGPTAIEAEGDQIQTVTRVWIGIVKSAALNTSRVAFTCQVRVQEEESSSGTEWGVDITPAADSGFVYDREHGAYVGELTKERKFSFELKSAPYDALWTVRIRPIITPLDTAEEGKQ